MKKLIFNIAIISIILTGYLTAQNEQWSFDKDKVPAKPVTEFQFLAYFTTQAVANNIYTTNDFLKGQTVGRLFGNNTTYSGQNSFYFEQRILPFIIYQPKLLDGKALLRMSFEIDWTWGDVSYGTGGNFGSAFSADQVNIQTQNIELEFIPFKNFTVNLGLQRLYDTPYNPYRTFVNTMMYTGYRLAYWGSDAVGISARYDWDYDRIKGGYYQLYENNVSQNDDVTLWELMYEKDITPSWRQGISLNYVYDRSNGEGGVNILGQGLNSALNAYNGVYRFPLGSSTYKADIFWLGTFGSYNPEFTLGRWAISGFANANFGVVDTAITGGYTKACDIFGVAGNLRAGYKYGQTVDDNVSVDLLFATGDDKGLKDGTYSGVLTGNQWGSPGAIFVSNGAYLLYPHGNVVNRFVAAISDLSNIGLGQFGGTINFNKAIIPNKLKAKIGAAYAVSLVKPAGGKQDIGTEINAMISYQPAVFMNIELHAAYLMLGDFYKSSVVNGGASTKPSDPYTVFCVYKWLLF